MLFRFVRVILLLQTSYGLNSFEFFLVLLIKFTLNFWYIIWKLKKWMKEKVNLENQTVDLVPNHSFEERCTSVKHYFESDLDQFVKLDETKESWKWFVHIHCTCWVLTVVMNFRLLVITHPDAFHVCFIIYFIRMEFLRFYLTFFL